MKFNIIKYIAVLFLIIICLEACMESVVPDTANQKKLTVDTWLVLNQNLQNKTALKGVNINVFNYPDSNTSVGNGFTNSNGRIVFDLPVSVIGTPYLITSEYNSQRQIKNINLCGNQLENFLFDTTFIPPVLCNNLSSTDSIIFFDNNGSRRLYQNTPLNIGYYTRTFSVINDPENNDILEVTLPNLQNPFSYKVILKGNQQLASVAQTIFLNPGERVDILIAVSTNIPGKFKYNLPISLKCRTSGNTGSQNKILDAEVVLPECKCNDYNDVILKLDPIQIGESEELQDYVFSNELACEVTLNRIKFDGNEGWQILSPQFPIKIAKGEKLSIKAKFTPFKTSISRDTLVLSVVPMGNLSNCKLNVILEGKGCRPMCPLISKSGTNFKVLNPKDTLRDTVSNRTDGYVRVSYPAMISTADTHFYIQVPDSVCQDDAIEVTFKSADKDLYSLDFYDVSPTIINAGIGETRLLNIDFTAPGYTEFLKILNSRVNGSTTKKSDSAFNILINLKSKNNCSQFIKVTAVINSLPDISPIINLRAYYQKTNLKPVPEYEVYSFGNDSRTGLGTPDNAPLYPPPSGDIWVDVANNNFGVPPLPPSLKSLNGIGMKIWKSGYLEDDFSKVVQVYNQFMTDPANKMGYSTNPINNLQVGDVVAFNLGSGFYSLIYIRRVDNGTENTSSKQSQIEFRAIYPIYNP